MPHTSHKSKAQRNKRAEVTDKDGWTRVTTTKFSRNPTRPLPAATDIESRWSRLDALNTGNIPPTDTPTDTTLESVHGQYKKIEERWLQSTSYHELNRCLEQDVSRDVLRQIDTCLIFGTGSFCGYVQGWIARHEVAMFQLAAFISVIAAVERITGKHPQAHAQEPRYNQLDTDFLSHLNVGTYITPEAFKAVATTSFVYLPHAELDVMLRALARNPAMALLSGGLDVFWRNEKGEACTDMIMHHLSTNDDEEEKWKPYHEFTEKEKRHYPLHPDTRHDTEAGVVICDHFREDKDVRRMPALDAKDEPFYHEELYFRRHSEEDTGIKVTATGGGGATTEHS